MSHFTCLVIGPAHTVKTQLQAFHEFECTGDDDQYVQDIDKTAEARKDYESKERECTFTEFLHAWHGVPVLGPDEERTDAHQYGFIKVDAAGGVRYIDHTNPNAEWDWWVLGGRWCGYFPLKDGAVGKAGEHYELKAKPGTADQLRKGDIDFKRARNEAETEAREGFAKWAKCFTDLDEITHIAWSTFVQRVEAHALYTIDMARVDYHVQPAIRRWKKSDDGWGPEPVGEYGFDEEAYVLKCRARALIPFSIVKDGKWFGKGTMHMFGCVSDETADLDWAVEVQRMYDALPDDTVLSLVDCHI